MARTVTGFFNGANLGTLAFDASGAAFMGSEGSTGGPDFITVDNFVLKASN